MSKQASSQQLWNCSSSTQTNCVFLSAEDSPCSCQPSIDKYSCIFLHSSGCRSRGGNFFSLLGRDKTPRWAAAPRTAAHVFKLSSPASSCSDYKTVHILPAGPRRQKRRDGPNKTNKTTNPNWKSLIFYVCTGYSNLIIISILLDFVSDQTDASKPLSSDCLLTVSFSFISLRHNFMVEKVLHL